MLGACSAALARHQAAPAVVATQGEPSASADGRADGPEEVATPAHAEAHADTAAPSAPSALAPPALRDCRVAAVGDSLTDPKSHGGGYLQVLQRRHPGMLVDNYGKGGNMVNQMRRRFERDVLAEPASPGAPRPRYTHLIVFGGVNDLISDLTARRTPGTIAADLQAMYAQGRARGMLVVAVTVAPWSGFHRWWNDQRGAATLKLNEWIRARSAAGDVDHVIDAWALLSCGVPTALCRDYVKPFNDGLHFGPAGHERLGEALSAQAFSDCR